MKIESLTNHYLNNKYSSFALVIAYIYNTFKPLEKDFPNYNNWFFNKQIAGISTGKREVLFIRDNNNDKIIIAAACLKKDETEQKICGIYVMDQFRNLGYGTKLLNESFIWLNTDKPTISINEKSLPLFESFINKYNWNLTDTKDGFYSNKKEFCYNRTKQKTLTKENL